RKLYRLLQGQCQPVRHGPRPCAKVRRAQRVALSDSRSPQRCWQGGLLLVHRSTMAKRPRQWQEVPIPLIRPSQTGPRNVAPQRTVNWYLVKPERDGDPYTLKGTPGLELLGTLGRPEQRGWHVHDGRLFVVAGAVVYEVYADGTSREWGKINTVRDRV